LTAQFRSPRSSAESELRSAIAKLSRQLAELMHGAVGQAPIFCQQATFRLETMSRQLDELLNVTISFDTTETWRSVYEDVLQSCKAHRYLSVALIRTDDYWRDSPGERSLEFNYGLVSHGFHIHRAFIIDEFFWPPSARTPSSDILRWIINQHQRGIEVSLVRLAALEDEPSLVCDMGIYGEDAVGLQQTDFEGKTVRFELHFDANSVRQAEQRWNQLQLYATPLEELLP
jgi:hypothetical protein